MRIALVTTPWSSRSGIADYTRHLLPYLRALADVDLFVEVGREAEECGTERPKSVAELKPQEYDRILYQLGNEAQHAFMLPLVKSLGGSVMMHDWVLFDLTMASYPELGRGGARGLRRAFGEGGVEQALVYLRNKRGAKTGGAASWFEPEVGGRWCAARAQVIATGAERLRWKAFLPKGRRLAWTQGARALGQWEGEGEHEGEFELDTLAQANLTLDVRGAGRLRERGDERVLGAFFRSIETFVDGRWREAALANSNTTQLAGLSADRFRLPFNRSVVRHADGFLVHSDWIGGEVLASRNAPTPIHRVHHGVERRWLEDGKTELRAELGLQSDWRDSFLIATFGAVQAHKRPQVLLAALERLQRAGLNARLLWVGEERPAEFDLIGEARRLGLEGRVQVTGWLPEDKAWRALAAADLCVQLRGPSTGGTSGAACQALSLGRPVIVSRLPEFEHLPTDCVLRLPQTEDEVRELAQMLTDLRADASRFAGMEASARRAVEEELHWRHVAKRYVEALQGHPRARASRRSLLVRFLHATAKEKIQDSPKADSRKS